MKSKSVIKPVYAWTVICEGKIWPAWAKDSGDKDAVWLELENLTGLTSRRAIKKEGYDVVRVKVQPVLSAPKKKPSRLQLNFPWDDWVLRPRVNNRSTKITCPLDKRFS